MFENNEMMNCEEARMRKDAKAYDLLVWAAKRGVGSPMIILNLSRRAGLTKEEKATLFDLDKLQQQVFDLVLEGDETAIKNSMLARIDEGKYSEAAKLAHDITDWDGIVEGNEDLFYFTRDSDAALLCLIAHKLGKIDFIDSDLEEMSKVVEEVYPGIHHEFLDCWNNPD